MGVVFQAIWYGDEVSVPASTPSTQSSTRLTPTLSLALAATVTVLLTVAPFAGEVMEVDGGVVSPDPPPNREYSKRFGEPVPGFVTLFGVELLMSA